MGWAGTLGGLALCVLIFLSAYVAFDDDRRGDEPREGRIVRLPAVPDAEVPRVPLARPPSRVAGGGAGAGGGLPPQLNPTPSPAAASTPGASSPQPTLGDTTSGVVRAVGSEVGRISPPVGQVIDKTGDSLGDAVDALNPRPPRRR